jgi:hypothetical protein
MEPLLRAAQGWKQARGPRRRIVDQVYLVPDVPTFLEAIAAWDEHTCFPILFDDPAWSLPFLRAFRPARVVRFRPEKRRDPSNSSARPEDDFRSSWAAATRAVARAWSQNDLPDAKLPSVARVPRDLGATPPGLVFSHAGSPMLPAAVALAAGHFEPLIELAPVARKSGASSSGKPARLKYFDDVLTLADARGFVREVEQLAEAAAGPCLGLGDACDFLTLAGDWPYRYRNDVEPGVVAGEHALDDLLGRILETGEGSLATSRRRWAFTGRMVGSPASSLYRAMCALFLQPEQAMLWNTYGSGPFWTEYGMSEAARLLERLSPGTVLVHQEHTEASLAAWHQAIGPVSRFGWFMVNSSGGPRQFSIAGGPGRPSDLPRGAPAAVAIIHSFSAANPLDPSTLAGRWLENGAFVYYGSMNEPYLQSFRTPKLVVELASVGLPLSAALRQVEIEPFGRAWRLVYLGDPLYTLQFRWGPAGSHEPRLAPGSSTTLEVAGRRLEGVTIAADRLALALQGDDSAQLDACLNATIQSLCGIPKPSAAQPSWRSALLAIDRKKLDPPLRDVRDELLIDSLLATGETERLLAILLEISAAEASPRVELSLETTMMARLMYLAAAGSLAPAVDLWDTMISRPWPAGCEFPGHFTERLAGLMASAPPPVQARYLEHVRAASSILADSPESSAQRNLVVKELHRLGVPTAPVGP